jgi:hypothetical protein
VAALFVAPAAHAKAGDCKPGAAKVDGKKATHFCGKAQANVRIGGKTYHFREGRCDRTGKFFTVNLGTVVVGSAKQKLPYFGLAVGHFPGGSAAAKPASGDGTYTDGVVVIRLRGKAYDLTRPTVILKWHRTGGTFSGRAAFGSPVYVFGVFKC